MPDMTDLTIHVPVQGELLLRLDGHPGLHPVGTFTKTIPVVFSAGAGQVSFTFTEELGDEIRRGTFLKEGVGTPTPQPAKSAVALVETVFEEHRLYGHEHMAVKVVEALHGAGWFSA